MGKIIKLIQKYWVVISFLFTIFSSILTGGWYLKGKIDASSDVLIETKINVKNNSTDIKTLHDEVLILQEDERLREACEDKNDKPKS